jgi:hypothetical protein
MFHVITVNNPSLKALVDAINQGLPFKAPGDNIRCLCCDWPRPPMAKRGEPEGDDKSWEAYQQIEKKFYEHFGRSIPTNEDHLGLIRKAIIEDLELSIPPEAIRFSTKDGIIMQIAIH